MSLKLPQCFYHWLTLPYHEAKHTSYQMILYVWAAYAPISFTHCSWTVLWHTQPLALLEMTFYTHNPVHVFTSLSRLSDSTPTSRHLDGVFQQCNTGVVQYMDANAYLLTLFCRSALAPCLSNLSTTSTCPFRDATISGLDSSCPCVIHKGI